MGSLTPAEPCELTILWLSVNKEPLLWDQLRSSHSQSSVYATWVDLGNSGATGMLALNLQ